MILLLPDQIGKMLPLTSSSTPLTGVSGRPVRMIHNALQATSVLSICGLTTANMNLLKDAGNKQFALEMELSGNSMREPSNGSVTWLKPTRPKEWTHHTDCLALMNFISMSSKNHAALKTNATQVNNALSSCGTEPKTANHGEMDLHAILGTKTFAHLKSNSDLPM